MSRARTTLRTPRPRLRATTFIPLLCSPHHGPSSLPWQYVPVVARNVCVRAHCSSELPPDARSEDVQKFFDGYGRIVDCRVMTGASVFPCLAKPHLNVLTVSGFGFVEFESSRDAEDALQHFNGKSFMGAKYATVPGSPQSRR